MTPEARCRGRWRIYAAAALVAAWPGGLDRESLADATGYSATSSSTSNALGRLRSLGLVKGYRASDDLLGGA